MEVDFDLFKIVEEDGRTIFQIHGKEEQRKKVERCTIHRMMDAIIEGWDISIMHTDIEDNLNIQEIADSLEKVADQHIISSNVTIAFSNINGNVFLNGTSFIGDISFVGTCFAGYADFSKSIFFAQTSFRRTIFLKDVYFSETNFLKDVYFGGAKFEKPGNFAGARVYKNTVGAGLKNNILCPIVKWGTRGKKELQKIPVTRLLEFNTQTMMDSSSNPRLKRYIDDEQWIESWRRTGKLQSFIFYIWEATSHCGRSIGLWVAWSMLVILLFSVTFTPAPNWWPKWWWSFWQQHGIGTAFEQTAQAFDNQNMNILDGFYLSIVSFTTLGFGDIIPANRLTRALLGLEVVLGYIMLGGLISIFANKFARRS